MRLDHKILYEKYLEIVLEEGASSDNDSQFDTVGWRKLYSQSLNDLLDSSAADELIEKIKFLRKNHPPGFSFRRLEELAKIKKLALFGKVINAALDWIWASENNATGTALEISKSGLNDFKNRYEEAFKLYQDEKRAIDAQRQHTKTHGVDLSNI